MLTVLNVIVLYFMEKLSWFSLIGLGCVIYLIIMYTKHIIHLAIDNDMICLLSRIMYENQQLKRRIIYLTNINQIPSLESQ